MNLEKFGKQELASLLTTYETRARMLETALQEDPNNELQKKELEQIIKQIEYMTGYLRKDRNPQVK